MHVIATAGHVDHGKSTLVRTITGTDPDRWDEEKQRGLTIDLGFGDATLPSGNRIAMIDVPGHIRFLKNMLAGVGAIDACLFVVSAIEGWKPQSEEHLRILEMLGLSYGVVALTNADVAEPDLLELAQLEVEDHTANTFLADAEVVPVGTPVGLGIPEITAALDKITEIAPTARDRGKARLWIDRSFAIKGSGTVVTGTLTDGSIKVGERLSVLPRNDSARIRGIQSHGKNLDAVSPGNRVALNLSGLDHSEVARGDVLVERSQWKHTSRVDAELTVLEQLSHEVSRRGSYLVYIGSGEFMTPLRVIGPSTIKAGEIGLVRLHLPADLPLLPGDRFILRESGRGETIGGGTILDIDPILPASRATPNRDVARVVSERGWVKQDVLEKLTGELLDPNVGDWLVDPNLLEANRKSLQDKIVSAGPLGLDIASLDERERTLVDSEELATVNAGRVVWGTSPSSLDSHEFIAELDNNPFKPPSPEGVERGELSEMIRLGLVLNLDGIYFSPRALDQAAREAAKLLRDNPAGFTVSDLRTQLGTSRKYILPILNRLDKTGVTRRREDQRIAGPRLPVLD